VAEKLDALKRSHWGIGTQEGTSSSPPAILNFEDKTNRHTTRAAHEAEGSKELSPSIDASLGLVWELGEWVGMKGIGVEEFPL
jgi:hypothetical protein